MTEISSSILRTTGYPIPDVIPNGSDYIVTLVSGSGYLTLESKRDPNGFYTSSGNFASTTEVNMADRSLISGDFISAGYLGNNFISGSLVFTPSRDLPANEILVKIATFSTSSYVEIGSAVNPNDLVFTVQSDNVGTSNDNQFKIPTLGDGYLYDVSTSDGYTATGVTGDHTITFPSGAGVHTVTISAELGGFPKFFFANGGDRLKILDISNFGIYGSGTNSQQFAFRGCNNLTVSATDIGHFENTRIFRFMFENTSVSTLPLIDTSAGTLFETTFKSCDFITFPALDFSSSTSFTNAWNGCGNLVNFPSNMFDNSSATDYINAFSNTNLSQTSIDNILVSIDVSGTTNGSFKQSLGSPPSSTGLAAINSLVAKGWTVIYTN